MIFCGCGYTSDGLRGSTDLPWPKLTNQCTFLNTTGHDHTVQVSFIGQAIARYHKPGISVIWTYVSLIRYGSDRLVDKGVQIIEAALQFTVKYLIQCCVEFTTSLSHQQQDSNTSEIRFFANSPTKPLSDTLDSQYGHTGCMIYYIALSPQATLCLQVSVQKNAIHPSAGAIHLLSVLHTNTYICIRSRLT